MTTQSEPEIPHRPLVVLGAGVVGLTIAYLAATDPQISFKISIVARDMPEDMDSQAWASPYAGANWSPMPMGGVDERHGGWERKTFNKLWDMIPTGLVKKLPSKIYSVQEGSAADIWWKDLVRDFRVLSPSELPETCKAGVAFSTISVNPSEYLPWLQSELLSRGVTFERRHVRSLDELTSMLGEQGILVNAASLGSKSIIGVEDDKLYPIRGQSILVQTPRLQEFLALKGDEYSSSGGEATYIIPRPGNTHSDTALLGGTFQVGNWDTSLDMKTAQGIFERCSTIAPCLKDKDTKILKHSVGLRPARQGGPRVEVERLDLPLRSSHDLVPWNATGGDKSGKMTVVHAYGFGPCGYQLSWGVAEEAVNLLKANL
ncbi:nucleotide-binding domain-containing protein [Leucogyrophana mollusca]|uniref:Nucleotide-binding domain-containing protein n=1 Tax=Leucogyrophana mollusca TaxID=85980 RepID=A0ACB8C129_9AGAM|nr:nucleotide-binding domain-containing protein [Leucogyrophana mollusca]